MKLKFLIFFSILLTPSLLHAEELLLGGSKNLSLLPMVAEQQGFYNLEKLKVRHEVISVGKLAMDAVLSGTVDVGVVVDTNLSFISFRENNLKVLATILQQSTDGLIECSPDFELTAKEIQGRTIGYFPATTSHIFLVRWLKKAGLTMKDINPIILQPTAMMQAIKSKAVDAVSIWNPWRNQIMTQLGTDCKESVGSKELYPSYAYLVVKQSTLQSKKKELTKLIRALLRADKFVSAHEKEAIHAYSKFTNMDRKATESVWQYSIPKLQLDDLSVSIIGETIDWLSESEPRFRGRKVYDYHKLFAPDILRSVAADRVTYHNTAE